MSYEPSTSKRPTKRRNDVEVEWESDSTSDVDPDLKEGCRDSVSDDGSEESFHTDDEDVLDDDTRNFDSDEHGIKL